MKINKNYVDLCLDEHRIIALGIYKVLRAKLFGNSQVMGNLKDFYTWFKNIGAKVKNTEKRYCYGNEENNA